MNSSGRPEPNLGDGTVLLAETPAFRSNTGQFRGSGNSGVSAVVLDGIVLTLLLIVFCLIRAHRLTRRRLRNFVRTHDGAGSAQDTVLRLASVIAPFGKENDDPFFIVPLFGSLGADPGAVLDRGGCCSGIHRLFITALETMGIRASQITLYHRDGRAQHCLAEVELADATLIVDVSYGLIYRDKEGRSVGLEDLQVGVEPYFHPLPNFPQPGYPQHEYYDFNFRLTRTANWTKSPQRRIAYSILNHLSGFRADRLRLPAILEWPHVLVGLMILPLLLMFCVLRLYVG